MKIKICLFTLILMLYSHLQSALYANTYEEYQALYDSGDSENIEEALNGFRQIMRKSPRHTNIADMEYIIAQNEKSYTRSLDLLGELYRKRKNYSKRDEVGFTLASRYMLQNSYISALSVLREIEKNYPDSFYYIEVRLMIASIYLKINESVNAIDEYNAIMNLYTDNREKDENYYKAFFGLGNAYFAQEQYYLALGTYNKLLDLNPLFAERAFVLYRSALCYEYTGRSAQALEIYNMIVDIYANSQSRTLASQRLKIHEAAADSAVFTDDNIIEIEIQTLEKPIIYESENINVYQFGRFREKDKCYKMLEIIESLGYSGYIVENDDVFLVWLDIYDDERNVQEMRVRFGHAGIPFFIIE